MAYKTEVLNFKKIVYPLKTYLNYVSLLNNSNDAILICYILCLLVCMLWLLWLLVKKFISSSTIQMNKLLYKAVTEENNVEAIRIIQKCPETINMFSSTEGYTPFLRACLNGNTQLVKFMITAGANLNIKSYKNEAPFYLAAYKHIKYPNYKDASCIHALYYAGADINTANEKGYNALQLACTYGHTSLVKWLISKGANINVLPDPYNLARMQGHIHTATVLKQLNCKLSR